MKTKLKFIVLLFAIIVGLSCNTKEKPKANLQSGEISVVSPSEFKEQSSNQTLIDVRTPKEFAEGHLEGAININYFDKDFLEQIAIYNKDKPIYVYCRSGKRSASASSKLNGIGFKQVYDLRGGIKNWIKNNHQIVK